MHMSMYVFLSKFLIKPGRSDCVLCKIPFFLESSIENDGAGTDGMEFCF